MLSQRWIVLFFIAGIATALGPIPRQPGEESLRSALDAVTRKQRSLDGNSQDYYNELRSFKYHGGEPERKFERERQGEREVDVEDEEMEFLPNDAGQLETVGNGCQGLNNKLLERALIDTLDTVPEQEEPVTSLFRERERSSSRKRGNGYGNGYGNLNGNGYGNPNSYDSLNGYGNPNGYDNVNVDDNGNDGMLVSDPKWQKILMGALNNPEALPDKDYQKMLYDRYRLGKLLVKQSLAGGQNREVEDVEFPERDQDQSVLYLAPAERRNVNGRYPIGRDMRTYRSLVKRYPVAKRSPKALPIKKQITDPKVAQDLGALFGTQSTDGPNRTLGHDHEHDHDHDHNHDHDHSHHVHDHERIEQHDHENSSEASTVTPVPKGQKEDARKVDKSETIEVRKKSIDWSQYFGIDRRRKKAILTPGQGTQNQDDEWMLQRYYENMAENLKPSEREDEREIGERRDYYEQFDSKKKELLRKMLSRLADNLSLENFCEALKYLRCSPWDNRTSNVLDNVRKSEDKRNGDGLEEIEGIEDEGTNCPELDMIEKSCEIENGPMDDPQSRLLYRPCVMIKICLACKPPSKKKSCMSAYMQTMTVICHIMGMVHGEKSKQMCIVRSLLMSLRIPEAALQCRLDGDSCLQRY